jgi:hypothetical protein
VVTELCLDWTLNCIGLCAEDHTVKLFHHLTRTKATQITALVAGRAGGELARNCGEIFAAFNAGFQVKTKGFGINEDVACSS